jgi:hypothetical protein
MGLRPVHLALAGLLLLAPLSACGKDSDATSSDRSSTTIASGTTEASGGSSSNDAITKYCADVHDYADHVADAIEHKDWQRAQQISQDAEGKLKDEAQAAAAEAQRHPQSYARCQQDAQAAAQRMASALQNAYGSYAP